MKHLDTTLAEFRRAALGAWAAYQSACDRALSGDVRLAEHHQSVMDALRRGDEENAIRAMRSWAETLHEQQSARDSHRTLREEARAAADAYAAALDFWPEGIASTARQMIDDGRAALEQVMAAATSVHEQVSYEIEEQKRHIEEERANRKSVAAEVEKGEKHVEEIEERVYAIEAMKDALSNVEGELDNLDWSEDWADNDFAQITRRAVKDSKRLAEALDELGMALDEANDVNTETLEDAKRDLEICDEQIENFEGYLKLQEADLALITAAIANLRRAQIRINGRAEAVQTLMAMREARKGGSVRDAVLDAVSKLRSIADAKAEGDQMRLFAQNHGRPAVLDDIEWDTGTHIEDALASRWAADEIWVLARYCEHGPDAEHQQHLIDWLMALGADSFGEHENATLPERIEQEYERLRAPAAAAPAAPAPAPSEPAAPDAVPTSTEAGKG